MCGIIGYTGKNNASKIILSGLKKLEYRGYDSAGKLQMLCEDEGFVNTFKRGVDEFILGKYNWKTIADATRELYKRVAKK